MLRLTKTKMVAMLLIATTLVMFNGVSAFAEQKTLTFPDGKRVYISSNAYQYTADASTYAAQPNLGIYCQIISSQYSAKNKVTGVMHYETKSTALLPDYAGVSFAAPSNYETSTIGTTHYAYYIGYERYGSTTDSY